MPKMTRADFLANAERVWSRALDNFVRDQHLAAALIGYDAMARETMFMLGPAPTPDMSEQELAELRDSEATSLRAGVIPVRGRWQDNLDSLHHLMRENRCVAALCLGEAWVAKDDTALDVAQHGLRPSEHPNNVETLYLNATWPREYASRLHLRDVTRDDHGRRHLAPVEEELPPGATIAAWLETILPGPHR